MIEKEPTSAQADRAEILRALLAAHGGMMPAKLARQKMRLSESTFSRLLVTMDKWVEVRPLSTNKRAHLLCAALKNYLMKETPLGDAKIFSGLSRNLANF